MSAPPPDDRDPPTDPIPDWVETVTRVAGGLGFNRVRVRWKLQAWVNRQRAADNRRAQAASHVRYEHRVCRHCGAVNDRDEIRCTRCDQALGARVVETLGRLGIHAPRALSISALVGLIIVVVHARILIEHGGGLGLPFDALIRHGASLPIGATHEWWRPLTSVLLHAGLFHLAFNLFALGSIGPAAEARFGRGVTLLLFVLTGTLAAVGSQLTSPGVGVGASGAIMGLVGAVGAGGHRDGTSAGRAVRNDMIKWVVYVFIFGFAVGADHVAHGLGLLAGAAFGLAVPSRTLTHATRRGLQTAVGAVALVALTAATVAALVPLQS